MHAKFSNVLYVEIEISDRQRRVHFLWICRKASRTSETDKVMYSSVHVSHGDALTHKVESLIRGNKKTNCQAVGLFR